MLLNAQHNKRTRFYYLPLNKYMLIIRHENVARLDDVCGMQEGEVVTRSGFEAPRRTLGDLQR